MLTGTLLVCDMGVVTQRNKAVVKVHSFGTVDGPLKAKTLLERRVLY